MIPPIDPSAYWKLGWDFLMLALIVFLSFVIPLLISF
jgi:hypothetical protein